MRRLKLTNGITAATILLAAAVFIGSHSYALGSPQTPQNGSTGLVATIPSPPPSQAATIAVPSAGQTFTNIPITVSGICPNNLLIKILANNVFVGSAPCINGSYSLKIDLFNGRNDIVAQDYDNLGQAGPASNPVTVYFQGSQFIKTGSQITITSNYAELGANPGQELDWPIVISGGTPPYAISTDWGDGQPSTLQSSAYAGQITIKHTYASSGIYQVTVTATDSNGATGFLQLVGVGNGQITASSKTTSNTTPRSNNSNNNGMPWWVPLIVLITLVPAFLLGSRHGKTVLLKKYQQ